MHYNSLFVKNARGGLPPEGWRHGHLASDTLWVLKEHKVRLGAWPLGDEAEALPPLPGPLPPVDVASYSAADRETLARLAGLEAMLLGFHLEHVAIAAAQIGYERGTGGTAGVDFLLLATFRRAFPALWESGLGDQLHDVD